MLAPILRIHTQTYIKIVLLPVVRCNPKYLTCEANFFIWPNFIPIVFVARHILRNVNVITFINEINKHLKVYLPFGHWNVFA